MAGLMPPAAQACAAQPDAAAGSTAGSTNAGIAPNLQGLAQDSTAGSASGQGEGVAPANPYGAFSHDAEM
jgi:hypothetical protein